MLPPMSQTGNVQIPWNHHGILQHRRAHTHIAHEAMSEPLFLSQGPPRRPPFDYRPLEQPVEAGLYRP